MYWLKVPANNMSNMSIAAKSIQSYTFDAAEDLPYLGEFGVVIATDEDSGEYGRITYSLSGQGSEVFGIDPALVRQFRYEVSLSRQLLCIIYFTSNL